MHGNMKAKNVFLKIIRYGLLIVIVLASLFLLATGDFSVQALLEFTPEDPIKAAIVLLLLYALKSATIFFPIIVLEIAAGHLFSPLVALGINFAGILIVLTIPYGIGHFGGIDAIQKVVQKYPRLGEIIDKQQEGSFFLCFFLRVISCLPGDIVTMYLGATRVPFWKNIVAGALGVLPGMVLATLLGNSIQDPKSPAFWTSAILMVTLSLLSLLLYYIYRRRLRTKIKPNEQKHTPIS